MSFWAAWALHAESQGRYKSAAELYDRAAGNDARPAAVLDAKRAAFDARTAQREERIAAGGGPAPPPARRGLAAAPAAVRPRATPRAPRAPPPPQQPQVPQQRAFAVFVDDATPQSGLDASTGFAEDDWPDFGTLRDRVKENERAPAPWTESALGGGAARPAAAGAAAPLPAPAFAFFVDEDLDAPKPDSDPVALPNHLETLRLRD